MARSALIGIPESLKHFGFASVWESFFERLNIDFTYSGSTTKEVVEKGIASSVSEACLPVKLIHGQVLSLAGRVEKVFLPRLINISGGTVFCPKFLGMPDMVKASIGDEVEILSPRIDLRCGRLYNCLQFFESARRLAPHSIGTMASSLRNLYSQLKNSGKFDVRPSCADLRAVSRGALVVGVLGYPYLIEDDYVSMGLVRKLIARGICVVKATDVALPDLESVSGDFDKQVFWYFSDRVAKAGYYLCRTREVDGLIHLTAYGCGPDAVTDKLLELEAKKDRIPYLTISVDECTGEAGVDTRIEAFVDMLSRMSSRDHRFGGAAHGQSNVSSPGVVGASHIRASGRYGKRSNTAA